LITPQVAETLGLSFVHAISNSAVFCLGKEILTRSIVLPVISAESAPFAAAAAEVPVV
jgi:hypothetical protein